MSLIFNLKNQLAPSGSVLTLPGSSAIADDPGSVNTDPEGASWFFKLKIKDKGEFDSLMSKDEYDKFCKENPS